jgi:MerR family transcriptional regulator, light-induced transcriptional regulator
VRDRPGSREFEQLIELEIVPRLMLPQRPLAICAIPLPDLGLPPQQDRIEELSKLVLTSSEQVAFDYVEQIRRQGVPIERLYLGLITSVARHLGDLWLADVCSFTDVTLGLWRLQHIVRHLSPIFQQDTSSRPQTHQALLVPLPGEQHTFGLYLVAEFFRRSGWGVWSMPLKTTDELTTIVRSEWFSLVGLSLSREDKLDKLAADIRIIRRASCNHGICVIQVFIDHPEFVSQVGADLMASDGRQAPAKAQDFVTSMAAYKLEA